jgi:hypothetical protein
MPNFSDMNNNNGLGNGACSSLMMNEKNGSSGFKFYESENKNGISSFGASILSHQSDMNGKNKFCDTSNINHEENDDSDSGESDLDV